MKDILDENPIGGWPPVPHSVFVGRYKHGEKVALVFNSIKILNCKIGAVRFTVSKITYDVMVPISQDEYTLIENVDSHCVTENLL